MAAIFLGTLATGLTAAEQTELNTSGSDLLFLWAEHDVPLRVQLRLTRMGYRSMQMFGVWADDRAGIRAAYSLNIMDVTEAHLTPAQMADVTLHGNQLLAAWMTASLRAVEEVRLATDAKLLRLPVMISRPNLIALRTRFELAHGRQADAVFPCASMIEKRLEEVEEGSLSATPLSEVISVDSSGEEYTSIQEVGVSVRVRKAPKAIATPTTTEELRSRFETLAISFTIAGYRHANRLWIRTATLAVWLDYVKYLLSDKVALYQLDQEGISIRASWTTVLSYDFNMRRLVCRKVLYDNMDFAAALAFARDDLSCKEQYFISPTAYLAASKKVLPLMTAQLQTKGKGGKGGQGDKRKADPKAAGPPPKARAKAKGKGGGGKAQRYKKTPDGRLICRFVNGPGGCNKGANCDFVHVCNKCLAPDRTATECEP